MDCEVYSIIDVKNDSLKLPANFNNGESFDMAIPKHDYNLLDNKDELSIRRFMDFIYPNSDGYLAYESHKDNFSALTQKSVGFSKQAIDYKGKQPKEVFYTKTAIIEKVGLRKKIRVMVPFDVDKLLNNSPNKYHKISLQGKRVNFNFKPKRIFIVEGGTKPGVAKGTNVDGLRIFFKNKTTDLAEGTEYETLIKPTYNEEIDTRSLTMPIPRLFKNRTSGTLVEFVATYPPGEDLPNFTLTGYNDSIDSQSVACHSEDIPKMINVRTAHYRTAYPAYEEPDNSVVLSIESPVVTTGAVDKGAANVEPNNSAVLSIKSPVVPSAWLVNEDEEDIYGYSGDEDDNTKKKSAAAGASTVQGGEQPKAIMPAVAKRAKRVRFASPLEQPALEEIDNLGITTHPVTHPVPKRAKRMH